MKKYYSIEILRFLTSISVLIYHYRHFFAPYNLNSNLNYFEMGSTLPFYNFLDFFMSMEYLVYMYFIQYPALFLRIFISLMKKLLHQKVLNRFAAFILYI